ncbi:MAG: FHA domain-containing protein [Planctomycetota bacterium]|jgi:pSer/pThr/pTyr-binding forkhead associated (FHA) protein
MAKLKVKITDKIVESYDVTDEMTIGRGAGNDIVLLDGSISRLHAIVHQEEDRISIEDNRSSNGVVINGKKVEKKMLSEGDILKLGNKILIFTVESAVKDDPDRIVDLTKKPLADYPMKEIIASSDVLLIIPTIEPLMEMIYEIAAQFVLASDLKDEAREGMIFAVQEAVRNGAKHGNKFNPGKVLRFRFVRDPYKVIALIEDQGPGFDYKAELDKAKAVGRRTEERKKYIESGEKGAGVVLMLSRLDRVEYNREGNQVILTKYIAVDEEEEKRRSREKWLGSADQTIQE